MSGIPYVYRTPYQEDLQAALDELRDREFRAGRYYPVVEYPEPRGPAPGAKHSSIEEARDAGDETGTRSILDIPRIASEPDWCAAAPCDPELVDLVFGTSTPTTADVTDEALSELLEDAERGCARYLVLFEEGKPREILFFGYSFD